MADEGNTARVDEAEAVRRLEEELQRLNVSEHLVYMLQSLSALAVDRMGLAPDAAKRRDLGQARLAIDAFKALVDVVADTRPESEAALHRSALAQLQMAYVGAAGGEGHSADQGIVDDAGRTESEDSIEQAGDSGDAPGPEPQGGDADTREPDPEV